jgi:SAM-dependent methyltransferase
MYERSAAVYDALQSHLDYRGASERLDGLIRRLSLGARSLLDVGCGTGRQLELLRGRYEVEGLDLSRQMLAIAGTRCPGVPLHEGDLVNFTLPKKFDVVCCLFGSIGHALTVDRMATAIGRMADHLNPGGALIVEPWVTPERFEDGKLVLDTARDHEMSIARMYMARREGRRSIYEIEFLVGDGDGVVHFREREELGLFTDDEYRRAFEDAGVELVDPGTELFGYGLYAGRLGNRQDL